MTKFDWYSGSYIGDHGLVVGAIQERLDARIEGKIARGRHGFAHAVRLRAARGFHSLVQWGGELHRDRVHVAFSGARSGEGAELFREVVPGHRVSRVDVALDFAGEGTWRRLNAMSTRVARDFGIKRSRIEPDNESEGRTIYLGSRTSTVFARIYEKGKVVQAGREVVDAPGLERELGGAPLETWVRSELEVKPKAHAKRLLWQAPAESFWGAADWSAGLYRELSGAEVERIQIGSVWRADDYTRTVRALVGQYGRFLERMVEDLGSWEVVGLQLRDELAELRAAVQPRGRGGE